MPLGIGIEGVAVAAIHLLVRMALPQVISRNQAQRISSRAINDRVVLQPETWYTCPAGKKAHVEGSFVCTGLGAAAEAHVIIATIITNRWIAATATPSMPIPRGMTAYYDAANNLVDPPIGTEQLIDVDLAAGETIVTDQDSGTNSEFNGFLKVTETPV